MSNYLKVGLASIVLGLLAVPARGYNLVGGVTASVVPPPRLHQAVEEETASRLISCRWRKVERASDDC